MMSLNLAALTEPGFSGNARRSMVSSSPANERRAKFRRRGGLDRPLLPERLLDLGRCDFLFAAEQFRLNQIAALSFLNFLNLGKNPLTYCHWRYSKSFRRPQLRARGDIAAYVKSITYRLAQGYKFVIREDSLYAALYGIIDSARCAASIHFDLSVIQLFRCHVAHDRDICPGFKRVLGQFYEQRFCSSELSLSVWCIEAEQLCPQEREATASDLITLYDVFEQLLCEQAQRDAMYFCGSLNRPVGAVKKMAIEDVFVKTYFHLLIQAGLTIPRFRWQAKSILGCKQFERLLSSTGVC